MIEGLNTSPTLVQPIVFLFSILLVIVAILVSYTLWKTSIKAFRIRAIILLVVSLAFLGYSSFIYNHVASQYNEVKNEPAKEVTYDITNLNNKKGTITFLQANPEKGTWEEVRLASDDVTHNITIDKSNTVTYQYVVSKDKKTAFIKSATINTPLKD